MSKDEHVLDIVRHQANMESLWATPCGRMHTLHESLLMAALRHLHAVVEGDIITAERAKKHYWDLESEM